MPTSNLAVWPDILLALQQVPHRRVLDVGPGHGKASVLLREYLTPPPETIDAVEMWEGYIGAYSLECLYDRVYVGDVTEATWDLDGTKTDAHAALSRYDVVLMGDVIEHIELDAAIELLRRIPSRVVICTPVDYFDNDPHHQHPPTEAHISHWTSAQWELIGTFRPVEVCYQNIGGWIVRLGPLG